MIIVFNRKLCVGFRGVEDPYSFVLVSVIFLSDLAKSSVGSGVRDATDTRGLFLLDGVQIAGL